MNVDKNATCIYGHAQSQVEMIHMYLSCIKGAEIHHPMFRNFDTIFNTCILAAFKEQKFITIIWFNFDFFQVRVADKVPPALAWLNQKHKVGTLLSYSRWNKIFKIKEKYLTWSVDILVKNRVPWQFFCQLTFNYMEQFSKLYVKKTCVFFFIV